MFAYKRSDCNAADISNKLTIELLFFSLSLSVIPSLKYHIYGFNEIEQQTDVWFLIADVIILCSYMQTLFLNCLKKRITIHLNYVAKKIDFTIFVKKRELFCLTYKKIHIFTQ